MLVRPKSIVNFERVVLLSLVLGVLNSYLVWAEIKSSAASMGVPPEYVLGAQVFTILVYLLLLWFIARKASLAAKWIYVVLTLLSLVIGIGGISDAFALGALPAVLTLAQHALSLVSIWLLFRPDASAWFQEGRGPIEP